MTPKVPPAGGYQSYVQYLDENTGIVATPTSRPAALMLAEQILQLVGASGVRRGEAQDALRAVEALLSYFVSKPTQAPAKCADCKGGYLPDGDFCSCRIGEELRRVENRKEVAI